MKFFCSYILILLIRIFSSNNKIYRIPFGLFKQQNLDKETNIINNIVNNGKYLNLSIGTPPQLTPLELDTIYQTFSISNKYFKKNESLTYEQISEEDYFIYEVSDDGFLSKDILNINNNVKKEINFILGTKFKNKKNNNLGIIGLHIPKKIQKGVYPFFNSLKEAQLINSFVWTLKFYDNISLFDQVTYNEEKNILIGEFIFGDEPCNYENDTYNYNEKGYYKVNTLSTKDEINWELLFNNIYITSRESKNNSKIYFTGSKEAEIIINFSYILAPIDFFYFLKENFFSEYFSNNICQEKKVDYLYTYIECDYDSSFRVASFPDICFEHADFEMAFNLTYKDLFIVDKKNKKYIFLMIHKNYFSGWIFGSVFLRKFQLVFDQDAKTIGYYKKVENPYDDVDSLKGLNRAKTLKTVFIFILIIILSFLLVILGMIVQRKFFNKNRKLRANELEENFSYESKNNYENNLEINNDKKIIRDENDKNAYFSI